MSTVDAVSSTSNQAAATGAERMPKQVLGQEDFLKLLTVQFASQDPLKPMEDTAFIAQMANFSSLELMGDLNTSMARLSSSQQLSAAQMILGKQVEVLDPESAGGKASGVVTAVWMDGDKTMISMDGKDYDFASVSRIEKFNPEA
jgi:flagellar basal-body rod modification protein FlgD